MKPRWLTFDELVSELQITRGRAKKLIRQGHLVGVCVGKKTSIETDWRYLDPSEKYKRALGTQEKILSKQHSIDLMEFPVITPAEFAAIAGLNQATIRGLIFQNKLIPAKIGKYSVFTVNQVREFLLKRERTEPASRRARCELLVQWCLRQLAAVQEQTMTAQAVANDDLLEGTLARLLRLKDPDRTVAIQEFWRRYQLARDVAAVLVS